MTVIECGIGLDVTQIPTTVTQVVNLSIGLQSTLVRQEIGAVALRFYVGRYGIDRVARHKVMQVQIADAHICIVGHSLGYQVALATEWYAGAAFQLKRACTLTSHQVCSVASAVGFQRSVYLQPVWYAVVAHQRRVGQSECKVDVLRSGTHSDISLHASHIGHVVSRTTGGHTESRWQMYVEPGKGHVLHIAIDRTFDADGMVRVVLHKALWHIAHKSHQVLLTYLSIQAETHGSWIQIVEGIEVHSQLGFYLSVGCLQFQCGYHQALIVHRYLRHQIADFQPTLLLRAQVPYYKRGVRLDVFYRIYTQINVG